MKTLSRANIEQILVAIRAAKVVCYCPTRCDQEDIDSAAVKLRQAEELITVKLKGKNSHGK